MVLEQEKVAFRKWMLTLACVTRAQAQRGSEREIGCARCKSEIRFDFPCLASGMAGQAFCRVLTQPFVVQLQARIEQNCDRWNQRRVAGFDRAFQVGDCGLDAFGRDQPGQRRKH